MSTDAFGQADGMVWCELGDSEAPPLLLIRPLGGSMALWGQFAAALANSRRIIMFDARGSGASKGPGQTSIENLARDACTILDARSVGRADLFGLSLGGMIATRFALLFPNRVASLVLASTTARGLAFERAGLRRALGFAACLRHTARRAERCLVRRVLSPEFRTEHPAEMERILNLAAETPSLRATLMAHAWAAVRHDARHELGKIRARTLIVAGDRDQLLGKRVGFDLARGIRGSERTVITQGGHDLSLEQPIHTAARVLEFLNESLSEARP